MNDGTPLVRAPCSGGGGASVPGESIASVSSPQLQSLKVEIAKKKLDENLELDLVGVTTFCTKKGEVITISSCDAERVLAHTWHVNDRGYVRTCIGGVKIKLHRFIMEAAPRKGVDHWDGNKLNNTRGNLRFATGGQNMANRVKREDSRNRWKGVFRFGKLWRSEIKANGKRYAVRGFGTEIGAAYGYDLLARKYHGEFARLNFPEFAKP